MKNYMRNILYLLPLLLITGCFDEQEFDVPDEFRYVAFATSSADVLEGETGSVDVRIVYSGPRLDNSLSIPLSVGSSGGLDAEEGVDYNIQGDPGSVSIPAGEASATITIDILDNTNEAGVRTLVLNIGDIPGHTVGTFDDPNAATFVLTIREDDLIRFGYTSFEEVDLTGRSVFYTKSGTTVMDNNPGEAPVDFVATGEELGFNSSFLPSAIGDAGAEIIGVNDGDFGSDGMYTYPDGNQGFASSDLDGAMEIVFDEIQIDPSISYIQVNLMAFFIDGGDWEPGNGLEIIWRTASGDQSLLNIRENGNGELAYSDGTLVDLSEWLGLVGLVDNVETGNPVVILENDNLDDLTLIDLLEVKGF